MLCCNVSVTCRSADPVCKCGEKLTVSCSVGESSDVVEGKGVVAKKCEDAYCTVEVNKVPLYHWPQLCRLIFEDSTAVCIIFTNCHCNTGTRVYADVGKIIIMEWASPHIGANYKSGEAYDGVVIIDRTA